MLSKNLEKGKEQTKKLGPKSKDKGQMQRSSRQQGARTQVPQDGGGPPRRDVEHEVKDLLKIK